jgi:hypothetical protein
VTSHKFLWLIAANILAVSTLSGQEPGRRNAPPASGVWVGAGAGAQALPDATRAPVQLEFTLTARSGHLGIPLTVMTIGGSAAFYAGADYHAEPIGQAGGFLGGGIAHIFGTPGMSGIYAEAGLDIPVERRVQSYIRGRVGLGDGVFLSASAGLQIPF